MKKYITLFVLVFNITLTFAQSQELKLMFTEFDESCKILKENLTKVEFEPYFNKALEKLNSSKMRFAQVQSEVKKADRDSIIVSFTRIEGVINNKKAYKINPNLKMKASITIAYEKVDMKAIAKKYNIIIQDESNQQKKLTKEEQEESDRMFALYQENKKRDSLIQVKKQFKVDSINKVEEQRLAEKKQREKDEAEANRKIYLEKERISTIKKNGISISIKDIGKFEKEGQKVKGVILQITNKTKKDVTAFDGMLNYQGLYFLTNHQLNIIHSDTITSGQTVQIIVEDKSLYDNFKERHSTNNVTLDNYLLNLGTNFKLNTIKFSDGEIIN